MKKILFISTILLSALCFEAKSQVRVNINIGVQPVWGPVGYDYVNYYYLPDIGVYYDVPRQLFVYYDFGRWNFSGTLPTRYGHYDLYRSYKVVINQREPWLRNSYYRDHYKNYRGRYQPVIRDSRDNRYEIERGNYERQKHNDKREGGHYDNGQGKWHNDNGKGHKNNGRGNGGKHDNGDR